MRKQAASVGGPVAAFGVVLVILSSLVSAGAGALTCHEAVALTALFVAAEAAVLLVRILVNDRSIHY